MITEAKCKLKLNKSNNNINIIMVIVIIQWCNNNGISIDNGENDKNNNDRILINPKNLYQNRFSQIKSLLQSVQF